MAVLATDIDYHLSGGAANADPSASLGGAISNTQIVDAGLHNLFDIVAGAESSAGDTEYRCFYVRNNAAQTLINAYVFVATESPSAGSDELLGLGTSAVNGIEQTVGDEQTAPAGVTFTQANGLGNALAIGDIPAGEHKAVWVRRDISVGASAYNNDAPILTAGGDTAA
ncbi:MAG: hypothetical protein KZQ99_04525 [Candidatus Thiodiazotropha sp. (ex Dulcina madagascariensis)]|nr:hypothetical protein [Candidatus Thiodiazotropha sp. (ex Dulcina madagascariensis)]